MPRTRSIVVAFGGMLIIFLMIPFFGYLVPTLNDMGMITLSVDELQLLNTLILVLCSLLGILYMFLHVRG